MNGCNKESENHQTPDENLEFEVKRDREREEERGMEKKDEREKRRRLERKGTM